jgi:predicted PhzF superfamily epimerase YddE/YHI9
VDKLCALATGGLPVHSVWHSAATKKLLVRLADSVTQTELEAIKVDTAAMAAVHGGEAVRGVIVTLRGSADSKYDFVSRYFAPWVGIPEDPVTGSAHTVLTPYWSVQLGKDVLNARQCSPRGGDMRITLSPPTIRIMAPAAVVLRGTLIV